MFWMRSQNGFPYVPPFEKAGIVSVLFTRAQSQLFFQSRIIFIPLETSTFKEPLFQSIGEQCPFK